MNAQEARKNTDKVLSKIDISKNIMQIDQLISDSCFYGGNKIEYNFNFNFEREDFKKETKKLIGNHYISLGFKVDLINETLIGPLGNTRNVLIIIKW